MRSALLGLLLVFSTAGWSAGGTTLAGHWKGGEAVRAALRGA